MVIKGRSRSNGIQLAEYLLQSKGNDRADVLEVRGTASPDSLKRSLLEMSMSSNLTKRGNKGLYHAQINPAIGEDRPMTPEDWLRAADVLEDALGYTGQKRAIVLHEKKGRLHGHVVWERYDHDTGKLRTDSQNFKKHDQAREQIEQELGHERTAQRADRAPTDKERLADLWQQHPEGGAFVKAAEDAGYYIAQGNARRPFRVVTPDGQSLDLVRQFDGDLKKDVRENLKAIRADLRPEDEALQLAKLQRNQQPEQIPADCDREAEPPPLYSYGFTVEQPLTTVPAPAPVVEPQRDGLSEKQDLAIAMIERFRQKCEAERETMPQQPPETTTAQPQPEQDKQPQKYYNPVTGQEMTPEAYQRLMDRMEEQRRQDQQRRPDRDRGLSIG